MRKAKKEKIAWGYVIRTKKVGDVYFRTLEEAEEWKRISDSYRIADDPPLVIEPCPGHMVDKLQVTSGLSSVGIYGKWEKVWEPIEEAER